MTAPPKFDPVAASGESLLSRPAVLAITGFGRTTLWRLQKSGDFPRSVRISANRVAWRASEVAAWLSRRTQAADGPPVAAPADLCNPKPQTIRAGKTTRKSIPGKEQKPAAIQ